MLMAHGDAFPEQRTTKAERKAWMHDRNAQWDWQDAASAPKDGSHVLVCRGPYSEHWGFSQSPPAVVHWWGNPGEEGFYLSHGLTSETDQPFEFTHWKPLGFEPR